MTGQLNDCEVQDRKNSPEWRANQQALCRRLLADHAYPHGSDHCLKTRANTEFALRVLNVEVHGLVRDPENPAYGPIRLAGSNPT
jgi:hypothetical protein